MGHGVAFWESFVMTSVILLWAVFSQIMMYMMILAYRRHTFKMHTLGKMGTSQLTFGYAINLIVILCQHL